MYHPPSNKPVHRLFKFPGGLHLPDNKAQSTGTPIRKARLPAQLILPLQQHIGSAAQPIVSPGERVLKGQPIALGQGRISAPVHAPTSGTVTAIDAYPVPHPSGLPAACIVIEADGEDQWAELPPPINDFEKREPELLLQRVQGAGVVGMGGAAFPTRVKLDPGPRRRIRTLVINGAECEPFITCDDMLMREQPERVVDGVAILMRILGAEECLIGIEDNKPEAIAAMTRAAETRKLAATTIIAIPTHYPSGGEKQLIRVLTGHDVPSGDIPASIGMVCQNVATAAAVADAVLRGIPLISRIVTLTGEGVALPCNLEVLIGTPLKDLVEQVGGYTGKAARLILGGPMMGFTLASDQIPLTKASNCFLAASSKEAPDPGIATPCIRCGKCADACPVSLLPQQMYWYARAHDLEKTQEYHLFDCIECGCCSHVCPARIPLVQYFRFAKSESWDQERERKKAELARLRHQARAERLARLEAEKQERLRIKKEALSRKSKADAGAARDSKQAAILAAAKRAAEKKAKLAQQGVVPGNTEHLTPDQRRQINLADARRKPASGPDDQPPRPHDVQDH